jgi:anti-sigma B factor antagonist
MESMPMKCTNMRGVCVVHVPEDHLDASNSREFKKQAAALAEEHERIVFDLSQVRFMDSSGLGALLSCLRKTNKKGGNLKLCCMTRAVATLFELVRMDRVFEVLPDAKAAVDSMAPGESEESAS